VWNGNDRLGRRPDGTFSGRGLYPSARRCGLNVDDGVHVTKDYRRLLELKEVDIVVVATPDHWHAKMCIDAAAAGKDVYCEKPMMQKVADGVRMLEAQKKTGRILQVGSQCVSSIVYEKARELLASGALGKVNLIEGFTNRNSVMGALHWPIPKDASPQTIDWDRFLGSAPKRPFEPARLFRWRLYNDYGTGITGDLFVHLFSGMHFVTGAHGPSRVFCSGGLRYWTDGREIPDGRAWARDATNDRANRCPLTSEADSRRGSVSLSGIAASRRVKGGPMHIATCLARRHGRVRRSDRALYDVTDRSSCHRASHKRARTKRRTTASTDRCHLTCGQCSDRT
jgi:predicted dehydrogenase